MMSPKICFFAGLGADERAFQYLDIDKKFPQLQIAWLKPLPKEGLKPYCSRLIDTYEITDGDILVGLSFGGLVATEISQQIRPGLTVLISSASTRKELPLLYKLDGLLNFHRLVPKSFYRRGGTVKHRLFGLKRPEQQQLFDEIVHQSDPDFVAWAVDNIVHWRNDKRPDNLFKIHGTADRIIPIHASSTDIIIQGAGHFMTWENAREVSAVINRLIQKNVLSP